MKIFRYVLIMGAGGIIGAFFMNVYTNLSDFMHPDPWVVINIKNYASQDIVGISVESKRGIVKHSGLRKDSEMKLPVSHVGEGSYLINFTMEDGTVCKSGAGYVESGYLTVEWITDEGAINDMQKNLGYVPNKCLNQDS